MSIEISKVVDEAVAGQSITDLHTHLYPPGFGTPVPNRSGKIDPAGLMLWGIDELLTYHYLIAEVYRVAPATTVMPYERFWKMSKVEQADHIWKHLFVETSPISEACRGVLTTMQMLGFDPNDGLARCRKFIGEQDPSEYIDRVMKMANVSSITMTNPVFDDNERGRWLQNPSVGSDPRFKAVLRIDPLLRDFGGAASKLASWGYGVDQEVSKKTIEESRRFLRDWIDRMKAIYLAVSLPPEFRYSGEEGNAVLDHVILPVCEERGLPFAMMIGSKLRVNPELRDGGDMVGKADVQAVVQLCAKFPKNKFLVTMLSRENQHELAVAARKFGNLMVFGCWWFVNNPSLIDEITRMRIELLGTSFIPQHSDARVLDQLIYKWDHSRRLIGTVLKEKYQDMQTAGWKVSGEQIRRDVKRLFADNFAEFLKR